jgi:hypothetical protein
LLFPGPALADYFNAFPFLSLHGGINTMNMVRLSATINKIRENKRNAAYVYWPRFACTKEFDQKTAVFVRDIRRELKVPVHFRVMYPANKYSENEGGILEVGDQKFFASTNKWGNIQPLYTIR